VRLRLALLSAAACAALTALAALVLDWSFERAAILSPVVVMVAGAAGFLLVLWTRILVDTFRARRRS